MIKNPYGIFNTAIKNGLIKRPSKCSKCGKECVPDGHHNDYNKPIEVVWLCNSCHRKVHSDMKKNGINTIGNSGGVTIRITKETHDFLIQGAKNDGRSLSDYSRRIIESSFCPECDAVLSRKACSCKLSERM